MECEDDTDLCEGCYDCISGTCENQCSSTESCWIRLLISVAIT